MSTTHQIKVTHRGWAGHLCVSYRCRFHLNTLVERHDRRYVVSTVGDYWPVGGETPESIGSERFYETYVFPAVFTSPYWEADTLTPELLTDGLPQPGMDEAADAMHAKMVELVCDLLRRNEPVGSHLKG